MSSSRMRASDSCPGVSAWHIVDAQSFVTGLRGRCLPESCCWPRGRGWWRWLIRGSWRAPSHKETHFCCVIFFFHKTPDWKTTQTQCGSRADLLTHAPVRWSGDEVDWLRPCLSELTLKLWVGSRCFPCLLSSSHQWATWLMLFSRPHSVSRRRKVWCLLRSVPGGVTMPPTPSWWKLSCLAESHQCLRNELCLYQKL